MRIILRASFLTVLLSCACHRLEVNVYNAPKDEQAPVLVDSAVEAHDHLHISWSLPTGWKQIPGSQMRVATLVPPEGKGKAELSIVQLSGEAGGDLANINRWRGQLGLEPVSSLAGQTDTVGTAAGKTLVVDLKGEGGQSMMAAILKDGDASWFFKMAGPSAVVAGLKGDFRTFLRSLRHAGS